MASSPTVRTIPPGIPFVDALASGLLDRHRGDPLALSAATVLLPTRRACRALTEAFLRCADGNALLLPRMMPIGEIDEIEAAFAAEDEPGDAAALDLPPAVPALQRRLLLSRLILEGGAAGEADGLTPARAARLADGLAALLDQVQTERLSFDGLGALVPDDYAEHWQITLRFLAVLTERWPREVERLGCLDPAARRDRVIERRAEAWRRDPPAGPVIAAGSTGSMPATADLLAAVARLPQGEVVLPGLDTTLTAEDRAALEASHPQYGMMRLLERIGIAPEDVAPWGCAIPPSCAAARVRLIRAALRPPVEDMPPPEIDAVAALDGVRLVACPGPQEEAGVIALALRRALETPGRTAALVTPDRALARRVAAELGRWEIEIDDSAGRPLADTPVGAFLRLAAACIADGAPPVSLLALLKHPLAAGGRSPAEFRARVRRLELVALRGPRPARGLAGVAAALAACGDTGDLSDWLAGIERMAAPFAALVDAAASAPVAELVATHVAFAEALAATQDSDGAARLWAGEDGEAVANFIAELREAAAIFPPMRGSDYPAFFEVLMSGRVVRPRYGLHPRLHVWGLLEARLQHADLLCLGGLNEGTWPSEPAADPWMSRPMRTAFGLPPPERRVGLSAHDFAQAFCAAEVLITRSVRVDGTPTVPARWLLRLNNVLVAAGATRGDEWLEGQGAEREDWLGWQAALDKPEAVRPVAPPAPVPPLTARPRRLSVTQIETWMRDPYAIYARHILCLRPLDPIDADPGAADRGTMIHAALDAFVREHPDSLPPDIRAALIAAGRDAFGEALARPGVWAFWWPRFLRVVDWFALEERSYRDGIAETRTEVTGEMQLDAPGGPFTLVAKADRIDRLADKTLSIIDYKTGGTPSGKEIALGFAPQLPLEAAMAMAGAFPGVAAAMVSNLEFWRLTGGDPSGERKPAGSDIAALAESALAGLRALIARFDDPATAYLSCPDPQFAPGWADYDHLARVQEWSATGNGEGEA